MLKDLLGKGYLPSELPPCFTSKQYAAAVTSAGALPRGFQTPNTARLCSYSLARAGNARFRRRLAIVNPINFYALSKLIVSNWALLDQLMSSSQLTMSRPVHRPNSLRALSFLAYDRRHLIPAQAKNRGSARVLLLADITEFYSSIYTHSIPWALHGKTYAKANQQSGIPGNDLDVLSRKLQYKQTIGIPIGPDTSLVLAECILAAVEKLVRAKVPRLVGFRFIDDFELCFKDHATAEHTLAILQEQLLEFELRLNPRKTALHIPPVNFEAEWVAELRRFNIRNNSGQTGDIVAYFDLMTRFLLAHPNEHVSKYGLKRFTNWKPLSTNLPILQALLCHVGVAEPGSIREVVESLLFLRTQGFQLDLPSIGNTLDTVVKNSVPLGYHYEVSWALWGLIQMGLRLDQEAVTALGNSDNSVVAIMALDAKNRGLAPNLDVTRFAARMTPQDLREEEWLLSYEANIQGWLPTVCGGDHVLADEDFRFLKTNNVRFYIP